MQTFILKRIYLGKITLGAITLGSNFICFTFELPWLDNQRRISCIPSGQYVVEKVVGHYRFGNCFAVRNVPNPDEIFIHAANIIAQIKGCIAPISTFNSNATGGNDSRNALNKLFSIADNEFILVIE